MGGDFIGSSLVQLSTGVDFVKAVIQVALGEKPTLTLSEKKTPAGVRFIFSETDIKAVAEMKQDKAIDIIYDDVHPVSGEVLDSSTRFGCVVFTADTVDKINECLCLH